MRSELHTNCVDVAVNAPLYPNTDGKIRGAGRSDALALLEFNCLRVGHVVIVVRLHRSRQICNPSLRQTDKQALKGPRQRGPLPLKEPRC